MNIKKIRTERRLSQRKLAERAHLAFRTIQLLEWEKLDPRLSTITKLGSALGHSPKGIERVIERYLGEPEDSLSSVSQRMVDEREKTWKLWLASFVDAFRRTPDAGLVAVPPDSSLSGKLRALLASTTETLCEDFQVPVPEWCGGIGPLDSPWFVAGVESLKAIALVESPVNFRKRNIFVLGNFMERA